MSVYCCSTVSGFPFPCNRWFVRLYSMDTLTPYKHGRRRRAGRRESLDSFHEEAKRRQARDPRTREKREPSGETPPRDFTEKWCFHELRFDYHAETQVAQKLLLNNTVKKVFIGEDGVETPKFLVWQYGYG